MPRTARLAKRDQNPPPDKVVNARVAPPPVVVQPLPTDWKGPDPYNPFVDHTTECEELVNKRCACRHANHFGLFSASRILAIRKAFCYGKNEREHRIGLRYLLDTLSRDVRGGIKYNIGGEDVCKKAFLAILLCSNDKWNKIVKRMKEGEEEETRYHGNSLSARPREVTNNQVIVLHYLDLKAKDAEPSPNTNEPHVVYLFQYGDLKEVYSDYCQYCVARFIRPVSPKQFEKIWFEHRANIRIRGIAQMVCGTCKTLRTAIESYKKSNNQEDLHRAKQLRDEHLTEVVSVRSFAKLLAVQCEARGDVHLTTDKAAGMQCPVWIQEPKEVSCLSLPKVHLYGVIDDGEHLKHAEIFTDWSGGNSVNQTISAYHSYFTREFTPHGPRTVGILQKPFTGVLYIRSDNNNGETKNYLMVGYLHQMVLLDYFTEVIMYFPPANHGKASADSFFGHAKNTLRKHDLGTPIAVVNTISHKREWTAEIVTVYNWVELLSAHYKPLTGIDSYGALRIVKEGVYVKSCISDDKWSEDPFILRTVPNTKRNLTMDPVKVPDKPLRPAQIRGINAAMKYLSASDVVYWEHLIKDHQGSDDDDQEMSESDEDM